MSIEDLLGLQYSEETIRSTVRLRSAPTMVEVDDRKHVKLISEGVLLIMMDKRTVGAIIFTERAMKVLKVTRATSVRLPMGSACRCRENRSASAGSAGRIGGGVVKLIDARIECGSLFNYRIDLCSFGGNRLIELSAGHVVRVLPAI